MAQYQDCDPRPIPPPEVNCPDCPPCVDPGGGAGGGGDTDNTPCEEEEWKHVVCHLRSAVPDCRPWPDMLCEGGLAMNFYPDTPGLFFATRDGATDLKDKIVKVGPVHIGHKPPELEHSRCYPFYGLGEEWLDVPTNWPEKRACLYIWDGEQWISASPISDPNQIDLDLIPFKHCTYDLGSPDKRWRNVYTCDLNLSNAEGSENEVDGTTGSWTIQEGSDDLFIINRRNGKRYRFNLEEVT